MRRLLVLAALAGACAQETGAADRISLRVYGVSFDNVEQDPYQGVEYVRIQVTDGPASLQDEFFTFDEALPRLVSNIEFGEGLQLTVEGWSKNTATNSLGQVLSRGRSVKFDMAEDGDKIALTVPLARLNTFSYTTQAGTAESKATSLGRGRMGHTATLLPDGKVLIVGGLDFKEGHKGDYTNANQVRALYKDAEVFDPASGAFAPVGNLTAPRAFHAAAALPDGKVLISGGLSAQGTSVAVSKTFEVYDPLTGAFTELSGIALGEARAGHTATLLDEFGNVLIAGGFALGASGEVASLTTGEVLCTPTYSCTSNGSAGIIFTDTMGESRAFHSAEKVGVGANGETDAVVLIGGEGADVVRDTVETFRLRQPAGFQKATLPKMTSGPRTRHSATYVSRQQFIHVVGGFSDKAHAATVVAIDSYQVQQQAFQTAQPFFSVEGRGGHGAVLLDRSTVLVFGGWGDAGIPLSSAEVIFEKKGNDSKTYIDRGTVGAMRAARGGALGVFTENGTAVILGGVGATGTAVTSGEFYTPL